MYFYISNYQIVIIVAIISDIWYMLHSNHVIFVCKIITEMWKNKK